MTTKPREFVKHATVAINRPLDEVFAFFADAYNLQYLTPPWLSFRILTPPPIEMRVGTLIDYRIKLHGLPVRWRTRITAWQPPHYFVDEQLRGPYKRWHHEHTFEHADGVTLCRDKVRYVVPGGPLSPAIHRLFVKRDIDRIFGFRMRAMLDHFEACDAPPQPTY